MNNRAQGLPMNALVLGALAILVLVALIAMFVGGGNPLNAFSDIIGGSSPSTVSQARIICQSACNDLKLAEDGSATFADDELSGYKYCKETFDLSEEKGTGYENAKCYDDSTGTPIVSCTIGINTLSDTVGC